MSNLLFPSPCILATKHVPLLWHQFFYQTILQTTLFLRTKHWIMVDVTINVQKVHHDTCWSLRHLNSMKKRTHLNIIIWRCSSIGRNSLQSRKNHVSIREPSIERAKEILQVDLVFSAILWYKFNWDQLRIFQTKRGMKFNRLHNTRHVSVWSCVQL